MSETNKNNDASTNKNSNNLKLVHSKAKHDVIGMAACFNHILNKEKEDNLKPP